MVPSVPIGSSASIQPQLDEASGDGASAAGSPAAASASLAPSSAARGASAAGAAAIPRLSLHLLGTDSAAANAAPRRFVSIPNDDELGIIAGYLPQDDQLVMRNIHASIRSVVDPMVDTLKLSSFEARAVLRQPHALHNLRELYLTDCNDEDLIFLAALLATMPKTNFELIVKSNPFDNHVSVDGIRPLAALRLSGLTLTDMPVPAEMSQALALSVAPLSITLPYLYDSESSVYEISQLPILRALRVGRQQRVTPETIAALQSHPALETLQAYSLSGTDICTLATNSRIQSMTIAHIVEGEAAALRALADNRVLTSLDIAVDDANSLAALSRNVTLKHLSISAPNMPSTVLSSLAAMPALDMLALSSSGVEKQPIGVEAIADLCVKPLKSLSFFRFVMNGAARLRLATAQTAILRLQFCTPFKSADFAALSQNRSITALVMQPDTGTRDYRDVLSLVESRHLALASLTISVGSEAPHVAKSAIQAAWTASGRRLGNLHLDVW